MQKATTGMRQPLSAGQNTLALSADSEKEPLEGFLPPEDSKKWLNDNYFQVRQLWPEGNEYKSAADNVYIITCKYYDSSANRYYSSRSRISGRDGVFISGPASAVVTIDTQGQLRVAPMYPMYPTSADSEKEPLEGFLPPEDSKKWLNDNHFLFWAQAKDYIIISEDDGYSSRLVIPRGSRVSISGPASAVVTIDTQGQLRVAPINTQE